MWPQSHLSDPDAYALLEGIELSGLYIKHVNTLMRDAGCKSITIKAIQDKKFGKLGKK